MNKRPRTVSELAAEFGRLGGQVKSERKAAAARKNGQKGGWPKGKRRKRGVTVKVRGLDTAYRLIDEIQASTPSIVAESIRQVAAEIFVGRPKGTPRKGKGKR